MSEITEGNTDYLSDIQRRGILPALGTEFSGGDCIEQSPNELAEFCEWLEPFEIKSYLEVGVSSGGLYKFMFEYVVKGRCYGIDLSVPNVGVGQLSNIFIGDSHSEHCKKWAEIMGPFDLVFIDASHKYEDIDKDMVAFGHLATKVLAFHDIAGLRDCDGARKHWDELVGMDHLQTSQFIDTELPIGIGAIEL